MPLSRQKKFFGTRTRRFRKTRRLGIYLEHKEAYSTWKHMHTRCYNIKSPDYPNWGGRGIIVCPEWHFFDKFLEDMGDPPHVFGERYTIHRKNNDDNYTKDNCKWASKLEQISNQRFFVTTEISK